MTTRLANEDEINNWDERIATNPDGGEFFQLKAFAEIKQSTGWKPVYIVSNDVYILVLEKTVPVAGKIWYLQKAPYSTNLLDTLNSIRKFAADSNVTAVSVEPPVDTLDNKTQRILTVRPKIQPTYSTVWVDLSPSDEDLAKSFSSKTRYNIRKAKQADIDIKEVDISKKTAKEFYNLFTETAAGRFSIRNFDYYYTFWSKYAKYGHGKFFFAYHKDKLVSADFIILFNRKASRKDAASAQIKDIRGVPALLEEHVIFELKKLGVLKYDLCGSSSSKNASNHDDPLYGITTFKTGFSKQITDYVGVFDMVIDKARYKAWRKVVERVTLRLHKRKHHENWY